MKKYGLILSIPLLLGGCAADQSLYYWGSLGEYRETVYQHLNETIPADEEIQRVSKIIAKAKESEKGVAPGMYAHLGMLYAQQGQQTLAQEAFNQEKKLFPESSHFIDYLITKRQSPNTPTSTATPNKSEKGASKHKKGGKV